MFTDNDRAYLLRQLGRANVVLFLGAGFSTLAKNRLGAHIPAGAALAKALWSLLDYEQAFDEEPLDEVYQATLDSGLSHSVIRGLLEEQLTATEIPADYDPLTRPFWYRIYTTNIDNVAESIYKKAQDRRLEILAFPHDDLTERDQFLERLQLILLNGRLPCRPDEITFSPRQYARASNTPQPLYEQFVRDFANRPVLFVGTRFGEPLFWQYLVAREERSRGISEQRPKSFLVTKRIPPTKRTQLERLNIVGIEAEVTILLSWLDSAASDLPPRIETLRLSSPALAHFLDDARERSIPEGDLREFSLAFSPVPVERRVTGDRSLYLLGAAPRWEDLFQGLDAPRRLTDLLFEYVLTALDSEQGISIAAILGSAGCGKSTILRRLGIRLVQAGRAVYLTNSEEIPAPEAVRRALVALPDRVVLMFDNAEVALGQLPDLVKQLETIDRPPILLIASRTNDFDRLMRSPPSNLTVQEFPVPHLHRDEVEAVIGVLDANALLGELRGLSHPQRVAAFEQKAHRQILVAMREATTGKGFDVIIQDEFSRLTPDEAKALYLCTALATDSGYRLSRDEFVACARVPAAEALHILARNLRDIVVPSGPNDDLLLLRHRVIAEAAVSQLAPRPHLRDSYVRLLQALSPEVHGRHWRSRNTRFYKAIVNHKTIYQRFSLDIEEARAIYLAVAPFFGGEAHFWLQLGSLELEGEGGDLTLAENYLRSAASLAPGDGYIENAIGHLLLRKATEAATLPQASQLREEGSALLLERIDNSRFRDDYAVHILCSQRYRWAKIWYVENRDAMRQELTWLRGLATRGAEANPFSRRLRRLRDLIERAYLGTALPHDEEPRDDTFW